MVVQKTKNSNLKMSLYFMYLKAFKLLVPQLTLLLLIIVNYNSIRLGIEDPSIRYKVIFNFILFNLPILSYSVYRLWKEGYNKTGYSSVKGFISLVTSEDERKNKLYRYLFNFVKFIIFYFSPVISMYSLFGLRLITVMISAHLVARLFIYYFIREQQYVELSDNIFFLFKPSKKEEVDVDDSI